MKEVIKFFIEMILIYVVPVIALFGMIKLNFVIEMSIPVMVGLMWGFHWLLKPGRWLHRKLDQMLR